MREAEGAGGKGRHNETSQPMHTHPHHAIANWWEILPVSREGAPPTACLPLDGVGGLRHGNLENTSFESLISDIRPCGTMQFLYYSFNLPSSSVISIFIPDSSRTFDYPEGYCYPLLPDDCSYRAPSKSEEESIGGGDRDAQAFGRKPEHG